MPLSFPKPKFSFRTGWILGSPGGSDFNQRDLVNFNKLKGLAQYKIDKAVGRRVEISDRASQALACPATFYKDNSEGNKFVNFGADDVLTNLVRSSPLVASHLSKVHENLQKPSPGPAWASLASNAGYPTAGLYEHILRVPSVHEIVQTTGELDDLTLFRSIIADGLTATLFRYQPHFQDLLRTPTYDETFLYESKNYELLFALDDEEHLRVRPFGVAGLFVDGTLSNSEERVKRLNVVQSSKTFQYLISDDAIGEYECLLNDKTTTEQDMQDFFKRNPMFLTGFGNATVRPHLILTDEKRGALIPDFFVEPTDYPYSDIFEIKKPSLKIITARANGNRIRFTQVVRDGVAQLLEYRRFFEKAENRLYVQKKYGVRSFRPKMVLIAGRDWDDSKRDRIVNLNEELPNDLELLTYDAVLKRARLVRDMMGE